VVLLNHRCESAKDVKMDQREWYFKILEWEEEDERLNINYFTAVVLAEHLAKLGLTQRAPDAPKSAPVCTCSMDDGIHEWNCALEKARR